MSAQIATWAPAPQVTCDTARAGLERVAARDVLAGRARGLVVGGGMADGVLMAPLATHAVLVGYTGSGKTRGVIEPTIAVNARRGARRQPNMLIVDAKGTVRRETAALVAAEGYRVRVIDLASETSPDTWNPLGPVSRAVSAGDTVAAERELARIAGPLKATASNSNDRYWEEAAWYAIEGMALALALDEPEREPTLGDVFEAIMDPLRPRELEHRLGDRAPAGLRSLRCLVDVPKTYGCIQSVAATMLAFFRSAQGRAVASTTSIDVTEDLFGHDPCAYYIVVPDTDSAAYGYASLLIDYLYQAYAAEHDRRALEGAGARELLMIVDEFARLPRIPQIGAAFSAGRSRDVHVLIALQSVAQLVERRAYSEAEARVMLEQASTSVYMSCLSPEVAEDARLKSGGAVGLRELMLLEQGGAFVARAGHPMIKTRCAPFAGYRAALTAAEGR